MVTLARHRGAHAAHPASPEHRRYGQNAEGRAAVTLTGPTAPRPPHGRGPARQHRCAADSRAADKITRMPISGECSAPAAVPTWRTGLPDLVEVVADGRQWRRSSRPSAVHSWFAPIRRAGRLIRMQLYYRVIRTRVPSGIPDSRCNAAGGTRRQPLLTAWPKTDGSGQPCRPTVPGPPPKADSALE
jgi:hypothetical protein